MPAFISKGPDIPEQLIQAHEDGKVVFFCGAGISYRAGLPGFEGLVDDIYNALGTSKSDIEQKAYDKQQYDAVLHQLERRYPGQRIAVRKALDNILKPKLRKKGATETHQSLLQLATDRNGVVRIVTTNFDQIFEKAVKKSKLKTSHYSAPLLPIPKQSRWDGIVYLHGLMPTSYDQAALNRLILTSGDFGLAYLTERWAARFVSQLFKDYIVCFVGYSINDPVLRYMMDALAADELLGEIKPEAYAFASYEDGAIGDAYKEWEAKGVTPLLYEVPIGTKDHSILYDTINEWSNTYRDGISGKEMVVTQHASTEPLASSRSDFAVGRVLWALSDPLAAKHFSKLVPIPPLKWLEPLSEYQYSHYDLPKFGIKPNFKEDKKLKYSLINHPSPYTHSPKMSLVSFHSEIGRWDEVMEHLAYWLLRHLGNHELILWLVNNGGVINERFKELIEYKIQDLDKLVFGKKEEEIRELLDKSPGAIPNKAVKTLWRIILSGRNRAGNIRSDLYGWIDRAKRDGISSSLLLDFRRLLAPCVVLRKPFRWGEEERSSENEKSTIKNLVDWEIVLACDHVSSTLADEMDKEEWKNILPHLLDDATLLLKDALDLSNELDGANNKSDFSYIYQPSISKHEQNRGSKEWTALIEIARESWLSTSLSDSKKAINVAKSWWTVPYPVFKRMAMFTAAQGNLISISTVLEWFFEDDGWWLWSVETQRELCRVLATRAPDFNSEQMSALEQKILTGPPREMFKDDVDFQQISEREIWHLLKKINSSGCDLGEDAKKKLVEVLINYPDWKLEPNEKDEFPYWMGTGWVGEQKAPSEFELAPSNRAELVEWLRKNPSSGRLHHQDGWRERCRDCITDAIGALIDLSNQDEWLLDRWREVLQIGSEEEFIQSVWMLVHDIILTAPDDFFETNAHTMSSWLQAIAKTFEGYEVDFFALCNKLLSMDHQGGVQTDEPVLSAINHPVGHVTEALLRWWYRDKLNDGQGLHLTLKPILTNLCDTQISKFKHGRVLLSAHAITLFRVDQVWATVYLLPLFDWNRSEVEARSAWEGFLWSPRLYLPFLSAIKNQLLDTVGHYNDIGSHAEQYASFLTFLALDPGDAFSKEELSGAIERLPSDGLRISASTLSRALDGTTDQRDVYWNNRVKPFIKDCWPKTLDLLTPQISESIARVCVSAKNSFAEAVHEFEHWLQPLEHPNYPIHVLYEAGLCTQFPNEALMFLDSLIGDNAQWLPRELQQCLDAIVQSASNLNNDVRYIRLIELIRRRRVV